MPDEHRIHIPEPFMVSNSAKSHGESPDDGAQMEELRLVAEKIDQAVKLIAEIGGQVAKMAPKHKGVFDDAKMAISDVGAFLRQAPAVRSLE